MLVVCTFLVTELFCEWISFFDDEQRDVLLKSPENTISFQSVNSGLKTPTYAPSPSLPLAQLSYTQHLVLHILSGHHRNQKSIPIHQLYDAFTILNRQFQLEIQFCKQTTMSILSFSAFASMLDQLSALGVLKLMLAKKQKKGGTWKVECNHEYHHRDVVLIWNKEQSRKEIGRNEALKAWLDKVNN